MAPFSWLGFPSITDAKNPAHLKTLESLGIPYVIDIHTHFFPEHVMKLIWRWFDSVHWAIAYRTNDKERVKSLHHNGVKCFTTLNYAHKPGMAEGLNDWVFQNYKNWDGAIPFGTFYPEDGVLEYVQRAVEEYKFIGFKLHCEVSKLDLNDPRLRGTFLYLEEKGIPIVIHTGTAPLPGEFTGIDFFRPFMERFPKLHVIVAHMGAAEILEYAELLSQYPNLTLDTTMVFVDFLATGTEKEVERAVPLLDQFADQIYFGSDFPNIPYNLAHPIERLLALPITDSSKRKILYENAQKLLARAGHNFF
ncbi:amidohydrolase family protein [Leptospira sp. 96542]|nr:amidohydrolase family protein [Leptospira sp. 96542]